jgi:uncharacterized membrane protein
MDIPFYTILIGYLLLLGVVLVLAFFNIYHMVRFGMFDFTGKLNTFIYVSFSLTFLILTFVLLLDVPWFDTFRIAEILNISSGSSNPFEL